MFNCLFFLKFRFDDNYNDNDNDNDNDDNNNLHFPEDTKCRCLLSLPVRKSSQLFCFIIKWFATGLVHALSALTL